MARLCHGPERVVAIEREPTNLACLEANLAEEIADGRATVVKGAFGTSRGISRCGAARDRSGAPWPEPPKRCNDFGREWPSASIICATTRR